MRIRSIPVAGATGALLLCLGGGCASLPDVPTNTCGNGIVEPGEECDTFAPGGARCRSEDEVFACRFDCAPTADGKTSTCPSGFVCGAAEGICQKPTGKFGDGAVSFEASAGKMVLGDFDGDGRKDVVAMTKPDTVQLSSVRVFFFDGLSAPRSLVIPTLGFSPSVGDVNGDGRDDLVLGSYVGVNVFLGAEDRSLEPQAYGRFPFPPDSKAAGVIVHGVNPAVRDKETFSLAPYKEAALLLVETVLDGKAAKVFAIGNSNADPGKAIVGIASRGPADLATPLVAGNFVEANGCEEVVYGWKDEATINILEICEADGRIRSVPALPKVAVTLPTAIKDANLLVSDLNGDGHLDLVVSGALQSAVAFGRGDGTFSGRVDLATGTAVSVLRCEASDSLPCPGILALEANGPKSGPLLALGKSSNSPPLVARVTSVTQKADGVLLGNKILATKASGDWTKVVIADLNANGIADVVGASSNGLDLDFYNGTPDGNLNPSKVPTDFPVGDIAVGDFDGDLVNDVALVEVGAGTDSADDVSVAFGRPAGAPEDPLPMGTFPGIKQLLAGRFDAKDEMAEIGVIYQLGGDQISALDGDGSRQLLSPFGLSGTDGTSAVAGMPGGLALGHFTTEKLPGIGVLAGALSSNPEEGLANPRLWFAPFRATNPQLGVAAFSDPIKGVTPSGGASLNIQCAAGDLDGDGIDELVTLMPTLGAGDVRGSAVVLGKMGPAKFVPTGGLSQTLIAGSPITLETGRTGPLSSIALADLDGDGRKDGIAFLDRDNNDKEKATLVVFWNDGALGVTTVLEPPSGKWRGFAVLDYKGALPTTIVGLTDKGAYWFSAGASKRALVANAIDNVGGGQAVAAGDVSGDGIPDLLVANGGRVTVYPGLARKP